MYRKPTFSGQHIHWDSFSPMKRKILCLHWFTELCFICSSSRLQAKLDKIQSVLVANGYPNHNITSTFSKKIQQFDQSSQHGPKKYQVYLHLPWLGNVSTKFEKQITTAIQRCYFAVETGVVFTTRPLLPATKKDVLPAHQHNNVIYQFVCHYDSRYVGRTSQRLQERIKQHVPRSIRNHHASQDRSNLSRVCKKNSTSQIIAHDPAIGQHLLETLPGPANTVTANPLSLPKDVLLSISPLLKLRLSNLFNAISVNTRNFFTV